MTAREELNIRLHRRAIMDAAANCWDPEEGKRLAALLRQAATGHPEAKIPWPHRLLHEAADALESRASNEAP
jgi:mannose/cellobiose epimerase-like protein (N-acyl-D-glucosamine 2-epimerase family)